MRTVLVLEDSEDDLFQFQYALKKTKERIADVQFVYCEDGEAGLSWLKRHGNPDLIITDNDMMPMNGICFIESMKSLEANRSLPIAMLTGHVNHPDLHYIKPHLVALFDKNNTLGLSDWIEDLLVTYVLS